MLFTRRISRKLKKIYKAIKEVDSQSPYKFYHDISANVLDEFLEKHKYKFKSDKEGKAYQNRLFANLNKVRPFQEAIKSEIGKELLRDVTNDMDLIIEKIINEKASDEELAEYRALRRIAFRWANRIIRFEEIKKQIREV